jgi:hypothetical protein
MADENRENLKVELAFALAQGVSVTAWARARDVPRSTVYKWASEREVRKTVDACRRRMLDRAIGKLTKRSTWVVDRIAGIAEEAESESVRLRALRSMLSEMMAISKYSALEGRVADVEDKFDAQTGDANQAGSLS